MRDLVVRLRGEFNRGAQSQVIPWKMKQSSPCQLGVPVRYIAAYLKCLFAKVPVQFCR
jgi:hypothetical protein